MLKWEVGGVRLICIYCGKEGGVSEEHVVSAALGCKETLVLGVCRTCNSVFGHELEGQFANGLALIRNFFRIPNREGEIPDLKVRGRLAGDPQSFPVTIAGDGRVIVPPRALTDSPSPTGREKEFRIFAKKHEGIIEQNLRAKHNGLIWRRLEDEDFTQIIDIEATFDANLLSTVETNRVVAKYALNLLAYKNGIAFVEKKFAALKEFISGAATTARVGILEHAVLQHFPFAPPKHLFVVYEDGAAHRVTVFIWFFCFLPYAVIIEDDAVVIESFWCAAIDPYDGRFAPLFLGAGSTSQGMPFPLPERSFAAQLQKAQLGSAKPAMAAARRVLRFIEQVRVEHNFPTQHICYCCGRLLDQITPTCKYCGNRPVPDVRQDKARE